MCLSLAACWQVRNPFSVRVVVPCYKEDIQTLDDTLTAAVKAAKLAMDAKMANAGQLQCRNLQDESACMRLHPSLCKCSTWSSCGCVWSTVTARGLGPHKAKFPMQAWGHAAANTLVLDMLHHAGRKGSSCSALVMHTAMHHDVPCSVCG